MITTIYSTKVTQITNFSGKHFSFILFQILFYCFENNGKYVPQIFKRKQLSDYLKTIKDTHLKKRIKVSNVF